MVYILCHRITLLRPRAYNCVLFSWAKIYDIYTSFIWSYLCRKFNFIHHHCAVLRQNKGIMPRENWLIIGISGATCSGKTTVAKNLHSVFDKSVLLHQDEYFYDEKSDKHTKIEELNHINFEILSSIDMAAFKNQIRVVIESDNSAQTSPFKPEDCEKLFREKFCPGEIVPAAHCIINKFKKLQFIPNILIIEGFLIFNDDQLQDLCDLKFYFTMSKALCWERRKTRFYEPPDVPGYFEKYVWPLYLVHYDQVFRKGSNIIYIDGADSIENNFRCILHKTLDFLL